MMCNICSSWVRDFKETLLSKCHPSCKNRKIENEAKKHIRQLLDMIEYEASMGDGIPDEYYDIYEGAKFFIGARRVKKVIKKKGLVNE